MMYKIRTNELYHHGILGQKWGIRRYQNPDGSLTKAGQRRYSRIVGQKDGLTVAERKGLFKGTYEFLDKDSKKVGQSIVDDFGKESHIDWIGIKESERRKGYGQKALDILIEDSIRRGKKAITLDAAGLDPAARHIYEKKGFKEVQAIEDDWWDNLIVMKKTL